MVETCESAAARNAVRIAQLVASSIHAVPEIHVALRPAFPLRPALIMAVASATKTHPRVRHVELTRICRPRDTLQDKILEPSAHSSRSTSIGRPRRFPGNHDSGGRGRIGKTATGRLVALQFRAEKRMLQLNGIGCRRRQLGLYVLSNTILAHGGNHACTVTIPANDRPASHSGCSHDHGRQCRWRRGRRHDNRRQCLCHRHDSHADYSHEKKHSPFHAGPFDTPYPAVRKSHRRRIFVSMRTDGEMCVRDHE